MKLSKKQGAVLSAVKGRKKNTILLEGPVGTSKTYVGAVVMLSVAYKYPGSIIPVGRKNKPEIRKGTLLSFREAAFDMGLVEGYDYKENKNELYFEFLRGAKGSYIYFIEMDHTKDPSFFKLKGMNATCAMIDEADGIIREGFNMLSSRTGRANKNGAPDFTLMTCNANEAWVKTDYYDKYHNPEEHGRLPDDTAVIEFTLEDSYLPDDYYLRLLRNPAQWVERYLKNNWNFGDDLYSLFKYRHMDSIHVDTFERGTKVLAIDPARSGDRSTMAQWDGSTLADIVIIKDRDEVMEYDEQAKVVHDYAQQEDIGYQNIWVDAVGEGQGLIASLKTMYDWQVNSFVSNAQPASKVKQLDELDRATDRYQRERIKNQSPVVYADLRSEQTYLLSYDIEHANVSFYDGCPYLAELKKEATMHNHEDTGKVLKVESKKKVKERTMHSPDIFDCVLMGYYGMRKAKQVGSYAGRRSVGTSSVRSGPRIKRNHSGVKRGLNF